MRRLQTIIERGAIAQESIVHDQLMNDKFVFLGGTVNGSKWREQLINLLTVSYFNPVVSDWTEEHARRENQAKTIADINLYVITPKQHGFYTLVEMAMTACESRNDPDMKVIVVFLSDDNGEVFTEHQEASNMQIRELLMKNPEVSIFDNLETTADFINKYLIEMAEWEKRNAG
jgi:hypothetical protein